MVNYSHGFEQFDNILEEFDSSFPLLFDGLHRRVTTNKKPGFLFDKVASCLIGDLRARNKSPLN